MSLHHAAGNQSEDVPSDWSQLSSLSLFLQDFSLNAFQLFLVQTKLNFVGCVHSRAVFKEKSSSWANLRKKSRLSDEWTIQIRAVYHWDMSITLRSLNNIHIHIDSFPVSHSQFQWTPLICFPFEPSVLVRICIKVAFSGRCLPVLRRQGVNKSRQCFASILQTQVARLSVVGKTQ